MDDPRHREAEALFVKQASRQRTEYVVTSILDSHQTNCLEQTIRNVIKDEIMNFQFVLQELKPEPVTDVQVGELPTSLVNALEEL